MGIVTVIMKDVNKTMKVAALILVILGVVVIALVIILFYSGKQAAEQIKRDQTLISDLSNQLQKSTIEIQDHKLIITNLVSDLTARQADILVLSNTLTMTLTNLGETQTSLKAAQDNLARRDEALIRLEAHNQALETRANELDTLITNLNARMGDLAQKLTAAEGDQAALTAEVNRLTIEKNDLERNFNDLNSLRAQVKKIKRETNVARRLGYLKNNSPADIEVKGAQKLLPTYRPPPSSPPPSKYHALNVEVGSDGSVKIIPPLNRGAGK